MIQADALFAPFKSGAFDCIVCRGGLHHRANNLGPVISEVSSLIKPGGIFIVVEPCNDNIVFRKIREYVYTKYETFEEDVEEGLTTENIYKTFNNHSFRITEIKHYGFLAYALLINTDAIPFTEKILKLIPFEVVFSHLLIFFDEFLAKIPILKKLSFGITLSARKE